MEAAAGGEDGEEPPRETRVLGSELVETYTVRSGEAVRDVRAAGMGQRARRLSGAGERLRPGSVPGCHRQLCPAGAVPTLGMERDVWDKFPRGFGERSRVGAGLRREKRPRAPRSLGPSGEAEAPWASVVFLPAYIYVYVRMFMRDCYRVNIAFKAGLNKAENLSFAWKYH